MTRPSMLVRFVVSAAVGLFAAFGAGAIATPNQPRTGTQTGTLVAATLPPAPIGVPATAAATQLPIGVASPGAPAESGATVPTSTPGPVASFQLTGGDGPVAFGVIPPVVPPVPAQPLPPTSTIQLASYTGWKQTGGDQSTVRPPWWNPDVPRVEPITQFDGGPFQNFNCTLASGSMLAKLVYGIVTTGSQLRTLQDDQDGGTSLNDLNTAINRGWGVGFSVAALTPLQFRALIYGGAGAVLGGIYGVFPLQYRIQQNFTGGHAIYIDGFRPPSPDGPAAYYVIDPIGRPWLGYRGDWIPADLIESFAEALGGGLMDAAYGFAGGTMPSRHPVLPPDAFPGAGPTSPAPGATPTDPLPTGSLPPPPEIDPGTDSQPQGAPPTGGTVETGGGEVTVDPGTCTESPPPPLCPSGLLGTILGGSTGSSGSSGATGPPSTAPSGTSPPGTALPTHVTGVLPPWLRPDLVWATLVAEGTYQLVYAVTPGSILNVWYWGSTASSGGSIVKVPGDLARINGQSVDVVTLTVDPTKSYQFVASGSLATSKGLSDVGLIVAGH